MKTLSLGDGRSLSHSFSPPNLENKLLAQASALLEPRTAAPLPNLFQQSVGMSSLTSTTSKLLSSTGPPSSSILSTQNTLLITPSPLISAAKWSGASTSVAGSSLVNRFICPGDLKATGDGGDQDRDTPITISCTGEDSSVLHSEEDADMSDMSDISYESEEEADSSSAMLDSFRQEEEDGAGSAEEAELVKQEDFEEVQTEQRDREEEIKDKKFLLLNLVCCSLVNKSKPPGQEDWDSEDSVWTRITQLSKDISEEDPLFLLKVAVYTRQELNIRITANFLLALAAHLGSTKSHVRRFFCAVVQLPSDWLEVTRIYSTCYSRSLPMCLKKGLTDKFKQFSEYQLAKYNTRKHRCKHNSKKPKGKFEADRRNSLKDKRQRRKARTASTTTPDVIFPCRHCSRPCLSRIGLTPTEGQLKKWADLVRSEPAMIRKLCMGDSKKQVVDKKQSEFTLKKMIKRLHIKEPAEHVMAILGRKYPSDAKAFIHSGMRGTWDRDRAGKRMKLKEPETWERLLGREGNKAKTWEKLIDNNSLPFMAMLRNLRNMITAGISEAHHKKILNKLTNKKAVIQSRQFPTRFLAAYKVMLGLQNLATTAEKPVPAMKDILKEILKKIPKSRRFKNQEWDETPKSHLRSTLAMPLVCRLYKSKRAQLQSAGKRSYTVELLQRYRDALEKAVQISCRHNIPPLPGRTVVMLGNDMYNTKCPQDFCLPPDPEEPAAEEEDEDEEEARRRRGRRRGSPKEDDPFTPTMTELALLLAMMIGSSAEDFTLVLSHWYHWEVVKLQSNVLLQNVRSVTKRIKQFSEMPYEEREESRKTAETFSFSKDDKVDNIIVLSQNWTDIYTDWAVKRYRTDVNNKALYVQVHLCSEKAQSFKDRNCVNLVGFSEQTLRFIAERGSSRLLDHVEHLDKLYNVPPPGGAKEQLSDSTMTAIPASPNMRWRDIRVFVSSTFRDMHSERDVLVRSVFPELRRRAAQHCLHLQEVELRWGVTEEEQGRAAELCLSQVCRSHMMVVLLGERYGLVPPRPSLPELPRYHWLSSAPEGLSVTEMEIRQFQWLYPDSNQRMFCYFRDPSVSKMMPSAWKADFAPESREAESKMADLKTRLRASEAKVTEDYPGEWAGVVDGKPFLKNLDSFRATVLDNLWTAVKQQFIEPASAPTAEAELSEQEVHQEALCRQFFGRSKLLSAAVSLVEHAQVKGGVLLLEAGPGEGKTVFMAALGHALRTTKTKPPREAPSYTAVADRSPRAAHKTTHDVISYSAAASQSSHLVENLLRFFLKSFRKLKASEDESALPSSYPELVSAFHLALGESKLSPLVVLVDGVDLLQDGNGRVAFDWIPQQLPQGVCLVVSLPTSSSLTQTPSKKKSTLLFSLAQLALTDRREIVHKRLDSFGKKLSDSAFNNQVQTLITKKGAVSPLYLHLACEHLRNFASFDKLKDCLQTLPQTLPQLVQFSLDQLCSENLRIPGLHWALAALTVSSSGLKERELYTLLNTCNDLFSPKGALTWDRALDVSRKPQGRFPMASFTRIVHGLQSLIGPPSCAGADDLLTLSHPDVRRAFEEVFVPTDRDRSRAYLLLAAHLWASSDPMGADTFLHSEASCVMQLPHALMRSHQQEVLGSLLSSYSFLFANVRHGLLHHLLEIYSCSGVSGGLVEDRLAFLKRHASLLSSWPMLFVQQALNEPAHTPAHRWAQGMMGKGGVRAVEWLNSHSDNTSTLVWSFPSELSCLVLSPDGQMLVAGTGRGTLHFIHSRTGQVLRSLVSSCDGVSSCVFIKDGSLATTSFDGKIEMWDVANGCRTALVTGHNNAITGSALSVDSKNLATVSLDSMLKVWNSSKGEPVASLPSPCPMNCVTFDPEGNALAAGCWNGKVTVWNWLQNKTIATLEGHPRSVHSVAFSCPSLLCSGSVSGEVRVWSVSSAACVGRFQAHVGSTEALVFVDEGRRLLSAGSDRMLQLWSGGLGRSVVTLQSNKDAAEAEPPQKRRREPPVDPVLCVAVKGDTVAMGTRDGLLLYSLDLQRLGEKTWVSDGCHSTVSSLLWTSANASVDMVPDGAAESEQELLVSGRWNGELKVLLKRGEGLIMAATLRFHRGAVLALAKNHTYVASASEDCSVALWLRSDLLAKEAPHSVLRGHNEGVTCLTFSPEGDWLLSGGKDQALMMWEVTETPVLSKALHHCHRDWITGCVWTTGKSGCIITSSDDCRICFWDFETEKCVREICWKGRLTSLCSQGQYVLASSVDGGLHVWNRDSGAEICHISAHNRPTNHCAVVTESPPEDLTVVTASDDGTAKVWKPLQVEHCGTLQGHTGVIRALVPKSEGTELLTASEDGTVRCWDWTTESPPFRKGSVTALCFCQKDSLVVAGFQSGLLEFWLDSRMVAHKQVSEGAVTALCSMPDGQMAVGHAKPHVDVFRVVLTQQGTVSLSKVSSYKVDHPVISLIFCSMLLGVTAESNIFGITDTDESERWKHDVPNWRRQKVFLSWIRNDDKSVWLTGDDSGDAALAFLFSLGLKYGIRMTFGYMDLKSSDDETENKNRPQVTAVTMDNDFIVCGDVKGNLWFNLPPELSSWSKRKLVHTDRITALRLTKSIIVSTSLDKTLKIWDRGTKKQLGMFVCRAPVLLLEVFPEDQTRLVCGDQLGSIYFLRWTGTNATR